MGYNYSYSGADCDVYAVYGSNIKHLDSIATVSVSMYEAKAPVRRLGHASPVGFTGNIRSIAGSLIFIVKNEHPLAKVMEDFGKFAKHLDDEKTQKGFTSNAKRYNAGMIKPFKLMLMYKNEVDARGAGLRINNLEFISEGIVTSVNDIVSEVVLQFVATDIDQLELEKVRQPEAPEKDVEEIQAKKLNEGYFIVKAIVKTYDEEDKVIKEEASSVKIEVSNIRLLISSINEGVHNPGGSGAESIIPPNISLKSVGDLEAMLAKYPQGVELVLSILELELSVTEGTGAMPYTSLRREDITVSEFDR
jgi:hypothetical protein